MSDGDLKLLLSCSLLKVEEETVN